MGGSGERCRVQSRRKMHRRMRVVDHPSGTPRAQTGASAGNARWVFDGCSAVSRIQCQTSNRPAHMNRHNVASEARIHLCVVVSPACVLARSDAGLPVIPRLRNLIVMGLRVEVPAAEIAHEPRYGDHAAAGAQFGAAA